MFRGERLNFPCPLETFELSQRAIEGNFLTGILRPYLPGAWYSTFFPNA